MVGKVDKISGEFLCCLIFNSKPYFYGQILNMNFLSSAVFWGAVIVLFGASIIIKEVFHINIPIFKIILGLVLIYFGIRMLTGGLLRNNQSKDEAIMTSRHFDYSKYNGAYDIVFGSGVIDLFKVSEDELSKTVKVDVVFGNGKILINDSIPTMIKMETAFGTVQVPGNSINGFGEQVYTNAAYSPDKPFLKIKASAVFGRIEIQSKKW